MGRVVAFLRHPIGWAVIGCLLLAALIWWVGPLIELRGQHPLDGVTDRLLALLALVLVFSIALAIRSWRRRRTNQRLVQGLAAGPSGTQREAQALQQRFSDALKVLQESARQTGKASMLRRTQFLYELPWYMFVGLPGSGKTTALLNAGLTFPLAAKMGQASVRGVGGTRNCEWWFTDGAVLIDTAGRYTSQDSDAAADAAAWETFLALLRKTRPRQPLNGVLLTINMEDLLRQSPADRKEHAHKLRSRLQELQSRLGVRPPVYVLVTKCDLIAGFNETFAELGREQREQVWGFSFPHDPSDRSNSAAPLENFASEFAALGKRLRDGLVERMQAEPDLLRRAAIFAFPQQFEGVKGILGGFLEQVFEGGGNLEERVLVRGVYFTSGTQEGSPIDRVLGALGRSFGIDQRPASIASSRGKAFFLTRLLKEVVFAERGLVGRNVVAESRRRRTRTVAWVAMLLVTAGILAGWTVSYTRNLHYVSDVAERLPEVQAAVVAVPPATGAGLSVLPNALDKVAAAPVPGAFAIDDPPLTNSLGLYQGRYLGAGADIGYHKLLDHGLMPRVARRVEERLRSANRNDLEFAYEALKVYMMMFAPEHFDASTFKAWVVADWDANLASSLSVEQRAALARHLDAAISRGAPQPPMQMDSALVANVREMLNHFGLEYRVLSRIKSKRIGADIAEFTAANAGGPNAIQVFERASGQPLHKGIPGLYTRDGYFKAALPAIQKLAPQLAEEEEWVLGIAAPAASLKDSAKGVLRGGRNPELEARVQKLFLQEYIKQYDDYLRDVRLVRLDSGERGIAVAGILGAADSPLSRFLAGVDRETQVGAVVMAERAAKSGGTQLKTPGLKELNRLGKAKDDLSAVVGKMTGDSASTPGRPLEMMVDDHFMYIHEMFNDKPPPAPIEDTNKLFNNIFLQLTAIEEAKKSKTPPPPGGGLAALKGAANAQPEPIKSMVATLLDSGATQGRQAERQGLAAEIKPIVEQCVKTIAGRYPFALGSKADVMPDDFGRMFGVGGLLDDFFQRRLSALVDVGVTPWAYRPLADGTRPPGGASLADFQRAAKIREAFFRGGGLTPAFKVDLRLLEMDPNSKELVIDIDGQALKFVAGNTAAQPYSWPSARIASQIKLTVGGATQVFEGPWAFFRMINQHDVQLSPLPERFVVSINVEGHRARLEIVSASALNPLRLREMQAFRCPDAL